MQNQQLHHKCVAAGVGVLGVSDVARQQRAAWKAACSAGSGTVAGDAAVAAGKARVKRRSAAKPSRGGAGPAMLSAIRVCPAGSRETVLQRRDDGLKTPMHPSSQMLLAAILPGI